MRLPYCLLAGTLLAAATAHAQTLPALPSDQARLEAIYRLTFRPDSTAPATRTEPMRLQVGSKLSRFESLNALRGDSVLTVAMQAADVQAKATGTTPVLNMNGLGMAAYRSNFRGQVIYKVPTTKRIVVKDLMGIVHYVYTEPTALAWTIGPATATVAGYACQRATATWSGRTWEAWFTRDVPVADGPYKFCGLPGLIVKVGDTRSNYVYELLKIRQLPEPVAIILPKPEDKLISKAEFVVGKADYTRNLSEQMLASGSISFKTPEEEAAFRQKAHERSKRPTNPIELK
jgi:GLPGLI family protein